MKKIVIVGGGIAGLSLAYELLLRNKKVIIVENSPEIGGLCRSVNFNGCRLDIGDHKLYLKDNDVYQKIKEVVDPDKLLKLTRRGSLYINGRYVDWPFRFSILYQLPIGYGFKIILDQFTKKQINNPDNYQDELLNLYGPTLYYSFFHPLTKKFVKTDPQKIHPEWAFSSIRAATKIEDKSFLKSYKYMTDGTEKEAKHDFSIIKFLIQSLGTNTEREHFYYFKGGFGALVEAYAEKIMLLGGEIRTNSRINAFNMENNKIKQCVINNQNYEMDHVVWTVNPFELCRLLKIEPPPLNYLNSKFRYFLLRKCNKNHQCCYYADTDISFSRATILSNHSKTIIHNNKEVNDVLCLEYTYKSVDEMQADSAFTMKRAIEDMKKVGLINNNSEIVDTYEINVPYTYPILTIDFKEKYSKLTAQLGRFDNITTFGRQARFQYDNIDVIIKETLNHKLLM
ncbi:MAG: FAD-dependent oxidoreductase [Candidatus Brocadiales bacterium]|nr:FAD-dependent oxidoreductase [Candidatus Brocadiales bacterium]